MSYQALYRQWRPTRFADFVGQEAIIATLRHQVQSGRVAHAYLFCGSRGTGKTSTAKVLARAINCRAPQDGEPCGGCEACERLADENNLDVVEIDAASNNGVDEIRDLRDKVKYPPQHGGYRVYIIDEVHMLSTGAFNALLKTLEEPPAHAVFILATTEPQKLPATVLSRCQRYDFRRIPARQIVGRLREAAEKAGARAEEGALERIARAAEGGMRDALSILDMCLSYSRGGLDEALVLEVLGATDRDFLFRFAQSLLDGNAAEALRAVDALMRGGRDPSVFARDVTQHLRALLLAQSCGGGLPDLLEITGEDATRYREQAGRLSREKLLRLLDGFLAAETDMKWSSQPRVSLEVAAVRACQPEEGRSFEALAERVAELERGFEHGLERASEREPEQAAPAPQAPAPAAEAVVQAPPPSAPAPDVWAKAMEALKRDRPDLFAQLRNGRYAGCDGHAYRVTFPAEAKVYLQVLGMDACRGPVEQALRGAGDAEATLVLEEESAAPTKRETAAADQMKAQIFDLFGRENVEILDE
ncbi:MAG: DNA polymerase III subunit gamma/tau [Clostridia bacterium]|nr:DNA polymerase III subunit gamma/tau [Clostridia bacterium]